MTYTYERYLSAKRSVEDRSLNRQVIEALRAALPGGPLHVLEVGGGIGTMVARLVEQGLVGTGQYTLTDGDPRFVQNASVWLADWAQRLDYKCSSVDGGLHLAAAALNLQVDLKRAWAEDLQPLPGEPLVDLLVCNSVLDLVDIPVLLPRLLSLIKPGGLCWLTTNFDGETVFEPGHPDDRPLMDVYHRSMDERTRAGKPAGDSRTGRHLFGHLPAAGAEVLAAGSSDWVVFSSLGTYPEDEAYFLDFILFTIEQELIERPTFAPGVVQQWLELRRMQRARGELVFVAHQLDFLARRRPSAPSPEGP